MTTSISSRHAGGDPTCQRCPPWAEPFRTEPWAVHPLPSLGFGPSLWRGRSGSGSGSNVRSEGRSRNRRSGLGVGRNSVRHGHRRGEADRGGFPVPPRSASSRESALEAPSFVKPRAWSAKFGRDSQATHPPRILMRAPKRVNRQILPKVRVTLLAIRPALHLERGPGVACAAGPEWVELYATLWSRSGTRAAQLLGRRQLGSTPKSERLQAERGRVAAKPDRGRAEVDPV